MILLTTGPTGAGKTTVARLLGARLGTVPVEISRIIQSSAVRAGIDTGDRDRIFDFAEEQKRRHGEGFFIEWAIRSVRSLFIVLSGIRTIGDINFIRRRYSGCSTIIGVDADAAIRLKRMQLRGRLLDSHIDSPDQLAALQSEQDANGCLALSDFRIENNGNEMELRQGINDIVRYRFQCILQNR